MATADPVIPPSDDNNSDKKASSYYYPQDAKIKLPGFGLHLEERDGISSSGNRLCYVGWQPCPFPVRERCMMVFMEEITNKANWHEKIGDKDILANWKREALEENRWVEAGIEGGDFNEDMFKYCISELEDKADFFKATGFVPTFDRATAVVKSDTGVSNGLKEALKKSASPLEDVPDTKKDWHPGSENKVLDLVHPSLWPLVYGLTRILPDREIDLEDCMEAAGEGVVIPKPWKCPNKAGAGKGEIFDSSHSILLDPDSNSDLYWSHKFQWLPCNVRFPHGKAKIASYINNLHPQRHQDLYKVVEQFIDKAVPMWDAIFSWTTSNNRDERRRVDSETMDIAWVCNATPPCAYECEPSSRHDDSEDDGSENYDEDSDEEWFKRTHRIKAPCPEPYSGLPVSPDGLLGKDSILKKAMADLGLQVIVKLANIHLTPEQAEYGGGSWHVEGQLNEHIAATALYYYDSENITESRLAFRTFVNHRRLQGLSYAQDDDRGIKAVWGIDNRERCIQNFGSVATTEGRLLAFPNLYQHRVMPFQLADKTKPGHRKILALFLVDPKFRLISTANVPPQRLDWWGENVVDGTPIGDLPTEIGQLVLDNVGEFPYGLDKAKELRRELMEVRTVFNETVEREEVEQWSFCEH